MAVRREAALKRGDLSAQITESTGREGAFKLASLSFGILDKSTKLESLTSEMSSWLKCDPDSSYAKNRKFTLRRTKDELQAFGEAEAAEWHEYPERALIYVMLSDMGF